MACTEGVRGSYPPGARSRVRGCSPWRWVCRPEGQLFRVLTCSAFSLGSVVVGRLPYKRGAVLTWHTPGAPRSRRLGPPRPGVGLPLPAPPAPDPGGQDALGNPPPAWAAPPSLARLIQALSLQRVDGLSDQIKGVEAEAAGTGLSQPDSVTKLNANTFLWTALRTRGEGGRGEEPISDVVTYNT